MEDADQILLSSLRQAGCSCLHEDASAVADLSTGDIVALCQQCLQLISRKGGDAAIEHPPMGLPKEMTGKFRVCAELAVQMQQLGYRGELSFHQVTAQSVVCLLARSS
jgi:hypothetical protein